MFMQVFNSTMYNKNENLNEIRSIFNLRAKRCFCNSFCCLRTLFISFLSGKAHMTKFLRQRRNYCMEPLSAHV